MYATDIVRTTGTMGTVGMEKTRRAWPVAGNFMPDFKLPSAEMEPVQTSDYRRIRSLVLVFVGECSPRAANDLLSDLARHYAQIARESAEVLAVVRGTPVEAAQFKKRDHLPFPVLADEDGQVHRDYGAMAPDGRSACEAVYVVGRFGKVYLSSRACDGPPLPRAKGILNWLYFIQGRCPECGRDELLM
jgi:peroxiredoxin